MRVRGVTLIILTAVLALLAAGAWWLRADETVEPIRVGVLHSMSGPLAVSEKPLLAAYRLAVEEINAEGGVLGRPLELDVRDGASDPAIFAREAERLLRDRNTGDIEVLVGCWSSASRKALLPLLERTNALLLYPVQFEGLESSPNIVYLGIAPNQQIGPAIDWAVERGAKRYCLVGSDYIYPHAANAIARDLIAARGGTVVDEIYMPLSGGDPREVAERIAASQPDVILNTVNGEANQGLLRALRTIGVDPATTPVIALSISEAEILSWDPGLFKDVILASGYFRTVQHEANQRFLAGLRESGGNEVIAGDALVSAYLGLKLWARAAEDVGTIQSASVRRAMRGRHTEGPGGTVVLDPESLYTWKPVRLGRVRADGDVEIIWDSQVPVPPRPWPMWRSRLEWESMVDDLHEKWGRRWDAPAAAPKRAPAVTPASTSGATPVTAPNGKARDDS